jgi:hypothetical protein
MRPPYGSFLFLVSDRPPYGSFLFPSTSAGPIHGGESQETPRHTCVRAFLWGPGRAGRAWLRLPMPGGLPDASTGRAAEIVVAMNEALGIMCASCLVRVKESGRRQ